MATEKNISSRIIHKHDIEANWDKAINFIPKNGEIIIYDKDENYIAPRLKIGDGINNLHNLSFVNEELMAEIIALNIQLAPLNSAILFTPQQLTEEQKSQARTNLGIADNSTGGTNSVTTENEKIIEIANASSDIYLLDLNTYSNITMHQAYNIWHPTPLGYVKLAEEVKALISYTMNKNLDDFKDIHLIGTDYVL